MRVAYLHPYEIHRKDKETDEEYHERIFAHAVDEDAPLVLEQGNLL